MLIRTDYLRTFPSLVRNPSTSSPIALLSLRDRNDSPLSLKQQHRSWLLRLVPALLLHSQNLGLDFGRRMLMGSSARCQRNNKEKE
jgi:hypothetical protein